HQDDEAAVCNFVMAAAGRHGVDDDWKIVTGAGVRCCINEELLHEGPIPWMRNLNTKHIALGDMGHFSPSRCHLAGSRSAPEIVIMRQVPAPALGYCPAAGGFRLVVAARACRSSCVLKMRKGRRE